MNYSSLSISLSIRTPCPECVRSRVPATTAKFGFASTFQQSLGLSRRPEPPPLILTPICWEWARGDTLSAKHRPVLGAGQLQGAGRSHRVERGIRGNRDGFRNSVWWKRLNQRYCSAVPANVTDPPVLSVTANLIVADFSCGFRAERRHRSPSGESFASAISPMRMMIALAELIIRMKCRPGNYVRKLVSVCTIVARLHPPASADGRVFFFGTNLRDPQTRALRDRGC